MRARAPHRWLVRYRRSTAKHWQRSPRFVTATTGYLTREDAMAKAAQLRAVGYLAHADTFDHLRILALSEARKLIGVVEHGGNNRGQKVLEIIRANGGTGPEPWCGDAVAWCYRRAGSKAVNRSWASVLFLGRLAHVVKITAGAVQAGDIVRYNFSHTGIFEHWADAKGREVPRERATHIVALEGNTGRSGAVSDSSTGGDGFYRKVRAISLVDDFRMVTK